VDIIFKGDVKSEQTLCLHFELSATVVKYD
jgi:hypothetical protein